MKKKRKKEIVIVPNDLPEKLTKGEDLQGEISSDEEGLAHSIIEGDKDKAQEGQLIDAATNQGLSAFNPDLIFQELVKDYQNAENIFGESILRLITGEAPATIKKNIKFPEYKRELKKKIEEKIDALEKEGLIDEENRITEKGYTLASIVMLVEELEELAVKERGEKITKQKKRYGEKQDTKNFKKGDRYKDIALKASIKKALRRKHSQLLLKDLEVFERKSKSEKVLIYALDASGSMKGNKIKLCKKAGIALAFKATQELNKVGLIVFGSKVEEILKPTVDFFAFIRKLEDIKAKQKTDLALTINQAVEMFPREHLTKHLVIITDAVPTEGENPEAQTLEAIEKARYVGITTSIVGVQIEEGEELAKKIVEVGQGRFYKVKNLENLDTIVLEDYYNL